MSAEDAGSQENYDEETVQPGAPAMLEKLEVGASFFAACIMLIIGA